MFQTTADDIIFSGHGVTIPEAGRVTRVPYNVEFYMFGPPGTCLSDNLGQLLEGGVFIHDLFIESHKTDSKVPLKPTILTFDYGSIPNLILHPPRDLNIGGMGVVPHLIGVEEPTHLQDLWQRLKPFQKPNKTLRVIWAACGSMSSKDEPMANGTA